MSVGAGSIKRAAKAVKSDVVANPTEEVKAMVETSAEKKEAPSKAKAEATKKPAAKKTTAKTAEKKAESKSATKKATTKKATTKTVKSAELKAEPKKSAYNSDYEAYGVGQQLPVHLM